MARPITQETRRARIHHSLHLRGRSATNSASSICHRRTSTSCHRGLVSHRGGSRVAFAGFRSRPTATLARAGASLRLSFTFCAALLFLRGSFRAIPDGTSTSSRLPTTREHDRHAFSLGGPHRGIDRRRVDIGHVSPLHVLTGHELYLFPKALVIPHARLPGVRVTRYDLESV